MTAITAWAWRTLGAALWYITERTATWSARCVRRANRHAAQRAPAARTWEET